MATIESLNKSISDMTPQESMDLIMQIREVRRTRPTKKIRAKKAPAKTKRAPKKRMAPQDMFAYAQGLDDKAKAALIEKLTGGKK